jgi:hypothetical protein
MDPAERAAPWREPPTVVVLADLCGLLALLQELGLIVRGNAEATTLMIAEPSLLDSGMKNPGLDPKRIPIVERGTLAGAEPVP